ncbi:MAG: potassium channel family protein [Aestuariibaculum sp.]
MFKVIALGSILITVNVVIQAYGNIFWLKTIMPFFGINTFTAKHNLSVNSTLKLLITSFLFFTVLHTVQTIIWASGFYFNPSTTVDFSSFSESLYFSIVTFTTLGYGDITLNSHWRLLSGLEAVNGIMLIGWSTAMMYSLIQNIYKRLKK